LPALSPGAWLQLLELRLSDQQKTVRRYERYYDGDQRREFGTAKWEEAFGHLFGPLCDNWMQIVVDAAAERLKVVGFRFGDERDDQEAWKDIWQPNNLDAESRIIHTEAIKCGVAYTLVDPNNPDGDFPLVTGEHPSEVVVACSPLNRRIRLAALKKWWDEADGYTYANLFLPDAVIKYRSQNKTKRPPTSAVSWGAGNIEINPLGVVPIVPFFNRPGMSYGGRSDLDVGIPLQDAINHAIRNLILGIEFQGFPQRAIIGWEPPLGENGLPLPGTDLKLAQSRAWTFKDNDVKLVELAAANLQNFKVPLDLFVQHLSAQTRTPPHYLLADVANVSGDGLKTAEGGLVFRCWDKIEGFSDPWEETTRLSFKALKSDKANVLDAETLWKDPENKSEAEKVDAATKLVSIGVPLEIALLRAGYSQKEVEQMKSFENFGVIPRLAQSPNGDVVGASGA
jgi:hypothetical protein